ncbi:RNase P modulator RnpM [Sulfoacidibacillus thermotolerans]|uniref:RNase P modulator RnpM n=1 Tax=Sulfoacidibacillus thermotolerans TaxID=1765684 RepID=UPI001FE73889|nr:YlxR family protein [Sulfoacidibacillus thermotolerans]
MRKVPLRQCVGCQEQKPKRSMVRIVLTPEGMVQVDLTGKLAGRGAYICPSRACFDIARKRKALERALKAQLNDEVYEHLFGVVETREQDN